MHVNQMSAVAESGKNEGGHDIHVLHFEGLNRNVHINYVSMHRGLNPLYTHS